MTRPTPEWSFSRCFQAAPVAFALTFSPVVLHAQQPAANASATPKPTAPAKYTGCVTPVPNVEKTYVLASANRCFLLEGSFDPTRSVHHAVTLEGLLETAAGLNPTTLHVQSVLSLQNACSTTCTLVPPGSRGIHGNEKPGHEGGTPGVVAPPSTPPRR